MSAWLWHKPLKLYITRLLQNNHTTNNTTLFNIFCKTMFIVTIHNGRKKKGKKKTSVFNHTSTRIVLLYRSAMVYRWHNT